MATFSAAFGYKTYIVPLAAASVDTAFTGVTQAVAAVTVNSKTISNVARAANVVTITTSSAHGFLAGENVTITATTNTALNGLFTIIDVPTTTTFTYAKTGTAISSVADTGTAVGKDGGAGGFVNAASRVLATDTISYAGGVFTAEGVTFAMNGTDKPVLLSGLTSAALETDTNTEDVVTYDDSTKGFGLSIATGKSWSVSLAGVADFKDAGYQILRLTELNTVADALRIKFVRVGPTGTVESIYGYGTLTGYSESIDAGSIVSWEATVTGYGAYRVDIDVNG
jgi:hypothetical protein